ncbi:MAG: hypothetical protein IKV85_10145 [Ruminococcus sp.]|nr:hypothetical protein [Ruminococcus sp.]
MKKYIIPLMAIAAAMTFNLCSCTSTDTDNSFSSYNSTDKETSSPNDAIQPFSDYFNAFISGEGEKVILATTPAVYIEQMNADGTYNTLLTETEDIVIKYTMKAWEEQYGNNISISPADIQDVVELSSVQLDEAVQSYKITYGDTSSEINITEGYELTYSYTIGGSKTSEDIIETSCFVKIENDGWKMLPLTSADLKGYAEAINNLNSNQ